MKQLENELTAFFAELLGLEVDSAIFGGKLPAAKCDALAVLIDSPNRGNNPSLPRYSVQLLGRYEDRHRALELADRIDRLFPHVTGGRFYILKSGRPGTFPGAHKGKDVTCLTANLDVRLTVK